jgi:hypothetical protein
MTADTQVPDHAPSPTATGPAPDRSAFQAWTIGLLVVLVLIVAGLGLALIGVVSQLDDLQQQVADVDGSVSLVGGGGGATGNVDDACRMLGALAFKAGVDVPAVFTGQDSVGTCETAAEEGFHQAKTG